MYISGWGFRIKWTSLMQAALAWERVKQFRLARRRLATQGGDGKGSTTLADLPSDVCNIIEESLANTVRLETLHKVPFSAPSRDCCHVIQGIRRGFEEWIALQGQVTVTEDGRFNSAAFAAYQDTPQFQILTTTRRPIVHAHSNGCENKVARDEFFKCLRLQIAPDDTPASMPWRPLVSQLWSDIAYTQAEFIIYQMKLASTQSNLKILADDFSFKIVSFISMYAITMLRCACTDEI